MSYLARLKQLDDEKISHNTPDSDPPKPPKPPFDSFDSTGEAPFIKKISDNDNQQPESFNTGGALKKLETIKDRQREVSRQNAIGLMNASPDTPRGIYVDDQIDNENVVLFVAVRSCMQTCELLIPRAKYDPFALLALVERLAVKHD